ncbi:MAG TPA: type II toxin-antitoxin system PemK/MazF family toxin [Planctomycetota bacterium]|nr:type II toxin-antitoxin system PemK/MazF family toxin [Planctomycetota bacterium]
MLSQGDIALIPIPFTDLSAQKKRPVIVISNNAYNAASSNIVVAAMTSNTLLNNYTFTIQTTDLEEGVLNHPGQVRADKIYTLAQSIVVKRFGKVKPIVVSKIKTLLIGLTTPTI